MKWIYILLLILIASIYSYPQSYKPMLGDSLVLYVFYQPEGMYTEIYYIYQDTLFNDYEYKVVWNDPKPYPHNIIGFIREDTINRQVYYNHVYYNKDFLWFDFSLFEGDSILLGTLSDWDVVSLGYFKVDSIGTKSTIKGNRRAIYLKGPPNEWGYSEHPIWVEGIGTLGDLLNRGLSPYLYNGELGCFFKDGDLIYKSSLAIKHDTCLLYSSGTNDITYDVPVTFYPNPFNDQIIMDGLPNWYLLIEIYDIHGRLAYSQNTHSSPTHSINTGHLNTGLYLIRIRNPETGKALANRIVIKK